MVSKMAKSPKLKIKNTLHNVSEGVHELEKGRDLPFCEHILIVVEDYVINTYEELLDLAAQDNYKDKEFLDVKILDVLSDG